MTKISTVPVQHRCPTFSIGQCHSKYTNEDETKIECRAIFLLLVKSRLIEKNNGGGLEISFIIASLMA